MKNYIEKCLRRNVTIKENTGILQNLPLRYMGSYNLYTVSADGVEWGLMQPKMELRLNTLRHDWQQIQKVSGFPCAFYFLRLGYYTKESMMDEGIPFIVENRQMFLPFLGMLLSEKENRVLKPVRMISFLTQKLLLCALYEKWQDMNVTKIAEKLCVTKMSVSRCFDEMEFLDIPVLHTAGKSRKIEVTGGGKELWEKIRPVLRNPVITKYELAEDITLPNRAGITALCEYSGLADNLYPTYGITKKDLKETNIKSFRQISGGEEIGCIVLELGYFIDEMEKGIQDPLSVWLSLSEEEKQDERVAKSIDEMLREYVW